MCRFYATPSGCKKGNKCTFLHLDQNDLLELVSILVQRCRKHLESGEATLSSEVEPKDFARDVIQWRGRHNFITRKMAVL